MARPLLLGAPQPRSGSSLFGCLMSIVAVIAMFVLTAAAIKLTRGKFELPENANPLPNLIPTQKSDPLEVDAGNPIFPERQIIAALECLYGNPTPEKLEKARQTISKITANYKQRGYHVEMRIDENGIATYKVKNSGYTMHTASYQVPTEEQAQARKR